MEPPDKRFSEFVDIVKSWIPRRSEPSNVSRDFWMPDQSCRVCYECDSHFTVFNRRHHCRLCGRVFCAKCTSNSIPVSSNDAKTFGEVGESIRVCNYCFKQWEQDLAAADNGIQPSSSVLGPSLSTASLVSTKSSGTGNGSTMTMRSLSHSTEAYPHTSVQICSQPIEMEPNTDKQDRQMSKPDSLVDLGNPSPNQFGFCMNRYANTSAIPRDAHHFFLIFFL